MLQTAKWMVANSYASWAVVIFFFLGGGAPPVAWAGRLVGAVLLYSHPGKREGWSGVSGNDTGVQKT